MLSSLHLQIVVLHCRLVVVDFLLSIELLLDCHSQMTHLGKGLEVREKVQVCLDILLSAHFLGNIATVRVLSAAHALHHHLNYFLVERAVVSFADRDLKIVCVSEVRSALSDKGRLRVSC